MVAGLALGAMLGAVTTVMGETRVAGWIERVRLGDEGVVLSAKLDTGALTSSLHAADVRWFTRDGEEWVAFEVTREDGRPVRLERKVVRVARIKRQGAESERRPTVMMGVCLGGVYRVTEVNLTDRTGFNYGFLVGRRFLAGYFVVDSSRTNTVAPDCAGLRKQ
jgi:hypothetical protein